MNSTTATQSDAKREFKLNVADVPSPPAIALKLLELFNDPEASLGDISKVLQVDPALTARLIGYCNSPLFGSSRNIETIERAIVVLGTNTVKTLSLSFSLVELNDPDCPFDFSFFWKRSLALAVALRAISRIVGQDSDEAFLLGLMFNMGEVALYRDSLEDYPESSSIDDIVEHENQLFGLSRFDVSAEILQAWRFPERIIELVKEANEKDSSIRQRLDFAWHLAGIFATSDATEEHFDRCTYYMQDVMEFHEEQQKELFLDSWQSWKEYAQLLNYANDLDAATLREVEMAARLKLTELSLSLVQENQTIEQEKDELRSSSEQDALTGVLNRRAYEEKASEELKRCQDSQLPFSLLVIDIDHFKSCNDTHGHQVGDDALKHVATNLGSKLRGYDTLYRYGGEEFVITLPECEGQHAMLVAERLRKSIEDSPLALESKKLSLTVSIGVASYKDDQTLGDLFKLADESLYAAKTGGRNRCILSDTLESE